MTSKVLCFRTTRYVLLVITICFLLGLTAGIASADTVGPVFSEISPGDGAVLNQPNLVLWATARDKDFVNANSLVMKVDGMVVNPDVGYDAIDESTEDYTTLLLSYSGYFTQGVHKIDLTVKDDLGNVGTTSWSFTVSQMTKVTAFNPGDGKTTNTRTPLVSATVAPASNIDASSIVMTLNDTPVGVKFDPLSGVISYTPAQPLNNETSYTVGLNLKDIMGNTVNASWKFQVSTYQDMPYTVADSSCQKCHDTSKHPMNNCSKCHGVNTDSGNPGYPLDDCYRCHYKSTKYPAAYHTGGLPPVDPPEHPVQITGSCTDCHARIWAATSIPAAHNINQLGNQHTTTTTGCTGCHSSSLTREHQRRHDSQGNTLTCYTCHNSTDIKVQTAIKNHDSNCLSCHGGDSNSQHPEHNNGLDQSCQTCHSSTILSDQQYHGKNSCSVCHENKSDTKVSYALSQKDTSCFACHDQGHNLNFVRKIPSDIPLYPGYKWSVPQDATLWAGEPWLPPAFNTVGAKLILTNRRGDLSGTQLFDWYTQNLASNGWEKVSGSNQGSQNFTLEYKKGSRLLTVIVYAGATYDSASAYVGYRVELLYK